MKAVIAMCLLSVALGLPQEFRSDPRDVNAQILRSNFDEGDQLGVFRYGFESDNGIAQDVQGSIDETGGQRMEGSYAFQTADGETVQVNYRAGSEGFVAESPILPQGPAMPLHAQEQVQAAAEARAAGVEWDEQGFEI